MINLNIVEKKYKNRVILKNSNITFNDTGFYLINGENGTGKSTLLKILKGIENFKGTYKYNNESVNKSSLLIKLSIHL